MKTTNPSLSIDSPANSVLDQLNTAQREAVSAPAQNLLILAGAGSGKTRVLIHRIAWLIQTQAVSPLEILAVTFTNKAASEMKTRAQNILNHPIQNMWIGTFHGIANRLLRTHYREAGLKQNFEILDQTDQIRVIKQLFPNENETPTTSELRDIANQFNRWKDQGLRSKHIDTHGNAPGYHHKLYEQYESHCNKESLVDFAELLLRAHELWLNNQGILDRYRERFKHILVDEFQDTNDVQFAWLKILAGRENYVFAVGDDDQSIYSWRGAQVSNMYKFQQTFENVRTVSLERNYRSTENILNAANSVIKHNKARLGKSLWTESNKGDKIRVIAMINEFAEAQFVAEECYRWIRREMYRPADIAILYRNNWQARVLEQEFHQVGLPYRIHGGLRFFERPEIRFALSYLRLFQDPQADIAFLRVVNFPPRGVGQTAMDRMLELSKGQQLSMWDVTAIAKVDPQVLPKAKRSLNTFSQFISNFNQLRDKLTLRDLATAAVYESGLFEYYGKDKGETGRSRQENLKELILAVEQFEQSHKERLAVENPDATKEEACALTAFLDLVALDSREQQGSDTEAINLMTVHAGKGLEFPCVVMVGMEEGLFPHHASSFNVASVEEERRLAYVGITRAMKQLTMTFANSRTSFGKSLALQGHSRFLNEISKDYCVQLTYKDDTLVPRFSTKSPPIRTNAPAASEEVNHHKHERVQHSMFGKGVVIAEQGDGASRKLQVKFYNGKTSWFLADTDFLTFINH